MPGCDLIARMLLRLRRRLLRTNVGTAVALQQALVGRREERESRHIVFVVDFRAFGKPGTRIASHNQADQYTVHIDLIAVWRSAAAKTTAIREFRINGSVDRERVAGGAVCDRDGSGKVDRLDDVEAGSLKCGHNGVGHAERLVDSES